MDTLGTWRHTIRDAMRALPSKISKAQWIRDALTL